MLWRRISIFSILLLCLGGAFVVAFPNPLFPQTTAQNTEEPRRAEQGHSKLMDQLNLSQDQQQKLQAIQSQYKEQISQRKQALRQATQELRNLMAGNASTDQIRTKHREVQGLRQQLDDVSFESTLAMRDVLTPDQRSQWAKLMEQRRANSRKPKELSRGLEGL